MRERAAAAIALRDKGRHEEALKPVHAERDRDRGPGRSGAAVEPAATISSRQYDGIAATPPRGRRRRWGGQRKLLRQMDMNPAAPGARY